MEDSKVSLQLQSIEDSIQKLAAKQGEVEEWKPDVDKKVDELRDAMFNSGRRWTCSCVNRQVAYNELMTHRWQGRRRDHDEREKGGGETLSSVYV